jgi:hypothetical protein
VSGLAGVGGPHTDTPEPGGAERKTAMWNHAWCKRRLGFVDEAQFAGKKAEPAEEPILGVWLRGGRGVAEINGGMRRSHVAGIDDGAQRSHVAGGRG